MTSIDTMGNTGNQDPSENRHISRDTEESNAENLLTPAQFFVNTLDRIKRQPIDEDFYTCILLRAACPSFIQVVRPQLTAYFLNHDVLPADVFQKYAALYVPRVSLIPEDPLDRRTYTEFYTPFVHAFQPEVPVSLHFNPEAHKVVSEELQRFLMLHQMDSIEESPQQLFLEVIPNPNLNMDEAFATLSREVEIQVGNKGYDQLFTIRIQISQLEFIKDEKIHGAITIYTFTDNRQPHKAFAMDMDNAEQEGSFATIAGFEEHPYPLQQILDPAFELFPLVKGHRVRDTDGNLQRASMTLCLPAEKIPVPSGYKRFFGFQFS